MSEALNPELVMMLRVESATSVAKGIRQFDLVHPEGTELPEFTAGAHLLVQAPNGVTRRYSLCSAPQERRRYSIAVKRESDGRGGSISMVDNIKTGDLLPLSMPRNEFELDETASSFLFIAGGIGITPMRSMIRHLINTRNKPFKLYYLSRDPDVTAYGDELGAPELCGKAFTVRIGLAGPSIAVPADGSILAALRAHGYRIRSSCESGTCGTCRTRLLGGEPDQRDLVLSDAERAHEIMVCVSRAHSPELVIEL